MRTGVIGAAIVVAGLLPQVGATAGLPDPMSSAVVERAAYVSSDSSRCVSVPGGVAGDAAIVNITNTAATGGGYGALRSSDAPPVDERAVEDQYSSVNFAANTPPNPNLAVVAIGSDGQFCYDGAVADHHVILDLAAVMPAGTMSEIEPVRLLDTRNDPKLSAHTSRCVSVPGAFPGNGAIVNITNTGATGGGYGALRSSDEPPVFDRPIEDQYSSVNFAANTPPDPNLAVVSIGNDGQFCYDGAEADHHVILDLAAIIPTSVIPTKTLNATGRARILDTRNTTTMNANTSRCVLTGYEDSVAIVNITNTGATGRGYGALRSSDTSPVFDRPVEDQYSSVNFAPNTPPNPNLAVVSTGSDGEICYDGAVADHHVILDVAAFIPPESINATEPTRLLDTRSEPDPPVRPDVYLNYHGSEQLLGNTDAQWPYVRANLDGFWGHWSSASGDDAQLRNTIELTRKVEGRKLVAEHALSGVRGSCGNTFLEDWFYSGVPGVPGTGVEGRAPDIEYEQVATALYSGENPNCWGPLGGITAMFDKYRGVGYDTVYSLWQATNVMDLSVPNVVYPRITPGSSGDLAYHNAGAVVIECQMDDCLFPGIREEFFRVIEETHARGQSFVWFTGYHPESGIGSSGWLEKIQLTYNAIAERGLWQPGDAVTLINYNGRYPALPERRPDGAPADTVTGILAWLLEQRPVTR